MTDCSGEVTANDNVADSWEEDGEVSPQFEQRQKQILKKKQKEEEMAKVREAAALEQMQCSSNGGQKPGGFKILKRPQSYGVLPSSSQVEQPKTPEQQQSKQKSLEERQAAYLEARERIFADYDPEKDVVAVEAEVKASCLTANGPSSSTTQPIVFNHVPMPRPRPPAALISLHAQPYQAVAANPVLDYAFAHHVPTYPAVHHPQRVPVVGQVPFYDSRIPPPPAPVFTVPTMIAPLINDQPRGSTAPYGRPPINLMQKPFSATTNSSLHQSGDR